MRNIYVLTLFLAIAVVLSSPLLWASDNVKVPLVLLDFSDCGNTDVADYAAANPDLVGGFINVHRDEDGSLLIIVHLKNGTPDTVYEFNMKCVGTFPNRLVTNAQGVGNAIFTLPPGSFGEIFAFDMYPNGAPEGNKYQSGQVDLGQ